MADKQGVKLRPLEREDLMFVHELNNNDNIMRYWFEEPYEAYVELAELYDKHIHDQNERRFIIEYEATPVGLIELVEIDYIHRRCELQIIIAPKHQGLGYASIAVQLALDYAFAVLNLHKLYLLVDSENQKAIHIYTKFGFELEGTLKKEFFINGCYRDAIRMAIFQDRYFDKKSKIKG